MAVTLTLGTPNQGTTGATSYTHPAHAAGDILVLGTETNVTGGLTDPTTPTGAVDVTGSPRAQGSNVTCITEWWVRAASSSETNWSVPAAADHQIGIPFKISGGLASGTPFDASTSGGQATGTTGRSFAGFNTVTANSLVVYVVVCSTDTASDNFTNFNTPTGLTGFTVHDQHFSAGGNGGGIMVASGLKATAGAVGALTWDFSTTGAWSGIALAFPPSTGTNASAENAASTGTAEAPAPSVKPSGGSATATGTAEQATPGVKPNAESSAVTGTAEQPTTSVKPTGGSAAATGTAEQPAASVRVNAECATATAAALDATVSTAIMTNALAECATATGTAETPSVSIKPSAEAATSTGTAEAPAPAVGASSATAAGTGAAEQPTVQTGADASANAECATVSVTVNGVAGGVAVGPATAAATVDGLAGAAHVQASAALASALATAEDATGEELVAANGTIGELSPTAVGGVVVPGDGTSVGGVVAAGTGTGQVVNPTARAAPGTMR